MEVQSLAGNLAVQLRHPLVGQTPPMRELLLGIPGLIRRFQRGLAPPKKMRIGNRDWLAIEYSRWWQTSRRPSQRRWYRHHATAQADRPGQSRHTSGHVGTRYRRSWARQPFAHRRAYAHARYPTTATGHAAYPRVARTPSIAVGGIAPSLKPLAGLEARIAWISAPALRRRKKASKARSTRLSVCCAACAGSGMASSAAAPSNRGIAGHTPG